jgi:putative transposase
MQYRRARFAGDTSFFTVNLAERHRSLLVDSIEILRKVVATVKERRPFTIDAMVILPEHLHALWTLPPGDVDYPRRWMLIKTGFSRQIPQGEAGAPAGRARENAASGNAAIGNTVSATKRTLPGMWTTFILIR